MELAWLTPLLIQALKYYFQNRIHQIMSSGVDHQLPFQWSFHRGHQFWIQIQTKPSNLEGFECFLFLQLRHDSYQFWQDCWVWWIANGQWNRYYSSKLLFHSIKLGCTDLNFIYLQKLRSKSCLYLKSILLAQIRNLWSSSYNLEGPKWLIRMEGCRSQLLPR